MDIDINGLIYIHAQAGVALAQANARIVALEAENRALKATQSPTDAGDER